jgi:hypothetical protein
MSEEFIIDTTQSLMRQVPQTRDPYDHLDAVEWVQKQIEYGEQDTNISGRGLVEPISKLEGDLIGCEIGVCHGFTTELWAKKIPNIKPSIILKKSNKNIQGIFIKLNNI